MNIMHLLLLYVEICTIYFFYNRNSGLGFINKSDLEKSTTVLKDHVQNLVLLQISLEL